MENKYLAWANKNRDKYIVECLPIVKKVAYKIHSKLPFNIELRDLQSAGTLGLIDAIDRFNPDKGVAFKWYAEIRIAGAIYDELRKLDGCPRSIRDKLKTLSKTRKNLESTLGRQPTNTEIAEVMGIDIDKFHKSIERFQNSGMVYMEDCQNMLHNIIDPASLEEEGLSSIPYEEGGWVFEESGLEKVQEKVFLFLRELSEEKKFILSLHYDEELSLKEVASLLAISESRARQIQAAAMEEVWEKLSSFVKTFKQPKA